MCGEGGKRDERSLVGSSWCQVDMSVLVGLGVVPGQAMGLHRR